MADVISQPITFPNSKKTAPNRLLKSAMTERLCSYDHDNLDERGKPTEAYRKLYEEWAKGGTGIIVLGNMPCDRTHLEAMRNAVLDPDNPWDPVEAFKPTIAAAKSHGALVIGQVTHGGRQTPNVVNKHPISSGDLGTPPLGGALEFAKPRPATIDEIHDIVRRFAFAGKALYDAGADGMQFHSAHGYLLSQFLSPRVNKRTDQYGGSLENRSRILFEIIDAVRENVPDPAFMLSIKINSADFSDGGFSEEESRIIVQRLEEAGLDLIELSGGTYESMSFDHKKESTKRREAFFIEFADRIRPHLKKAKLCVTGGFRSTPAMAEAINKGSCDIIGVARPLTAEHDFSNILLSGKRDAAKENLVNPGIQTASSYAQIGEWSKGRPIPDLSDKATAEKVEKVIMEHRVESWTVHPPMEKA